ncbi:unnamed protein product [Ilex paraguariensis]|uniref:Uncharacterized protein n=1 Tax=Ilex paraguariensis TaxID=185542 RepID=A0ABC8TL77_9AQUA
MSGSGRKRTSKWDLKEVPQLSPGDTHKDAWPGRSVADYKDGGEFSDPTMEWDEDGSYSTKMSPGLEDWRQLKQHHHSRKTGYDRSYRFTFLYLACQFVHN